MADRIADGPHGIVGYGKGNDLDVLQADAACQADEAVLEAFHFPAYGLPGLGCRIDGHVRPLEERRQAVDVVRMFMSDEDGIEVA